MKRNNFLRPAPVIITGKCKLKQGLFLNTFLCFNKYQSKIWHEKLSTYFENYIRTHIFSIENLQVLHKSRTRLEAKSLKL